ncbi:MAG: acetyltransferase [Pseudomonadota bacterium]
MTELDISANRSAEKWSFRAKVGRLLWGLARPFFALSPRPLWGWRRLLLRLFGAKIGKHVHIFPSVRVTIPWHLTVGDYAAIGDRSIIYALGLVEIGARATISQGAHICAGSHDYNDPSMKLLKTPITIGADAWICADAFVGPGRTIGDKAVVAARAVVTKDVAERTVVGGNPAVLVKERDLT